MALLSLWIRKGNEKKEFSCIYDIAHGDAQQGQAQGMYRFKLCISEGLGDVISHQHICPFQVAVTARRYRVHFRNSADHN